MFEFFNYIISIFTTISNFITSTIDALLTTIDNIAMGIAFISETILFLPPFAKGAFTAIFGVVIITLILGGVIDF